jgi:pimeloyl-ACP methyl ester carboxylesterase
MSAVNTRNLYEVIIPTDRWHIRAVSPVDIRNKKVVSDYDLAVIVHPGWAKSPERHRLLLNELLAIGVLPIGVDTRYGYSDRARTHAGNRRFTRLFSQNYIVGDSNPYFRIKTSADNRWLLRRPTTLLHLCNALGIGRRVYIGHSEGARIITLAALAAKHTTAGVLLVNGVGTGDSSEGFKGMIRSNINGIVTIWHNESSVIDIVSSAIGSVFYTVTHLRRTWHEKKVIQATDIWGMLKVLTRSNIPVSVFHAKNDELITYSDSKAKARMNDHISFYATKGNHSNIFDSEVRRQIVQRVMSYRNSI